MKPMTVPLRSLFFTAAIGGTVFLWGCSSKGSTTTCTDAGIDAAPICITTTPTGGGW